MTGGPISQPDNRSYVADCIKKESCQQLSSRKIRSSRLDGEPVLRSFLPERTLFFTGGETIRRLFYIATSPMLRGGTLSERATLRANRLV
jgi:hypothetical protein